jgi:hypothetical protein
MTLSIFGVCVASGAGAATLANAPDIKPQDSWTYVDTLEDRTGWHQSHDDITVVRSSPKEIVVLAKPTGSTMPGKEQMVGADWSRFRSVNGEEITVNQPMKFPLTPGKSWTVDYTEKNPNRDHKSEHLHSDYKVIGWEAVTVPAGTFQAIKIEADGQWVAEIAPAITAGSAARVDAAGSTVISQANKITQQTATGRLYKAFWYAPETKRFVKSIEEIYAANGVRSERRTQELEAFRPAS